MDIVSKILIECNDAACSHPNCSLCIVYLMIRPGEKFFSFSVDQNQEVDSLERKMKSPEMFWQAWLLVL